MPKEIGARPMRQLLSAGGAIATNNRFVEEAGAPLEAKYASGAPIIIYQRFRWPGSREGKDGQGIQANVAAFREMQERDPGFKTLQANMAWIRQQVLSEGYSGPVSLHQLLEMTSFGKNAALFLLYRADTSFDPEGSTPEAQLPASMADVYKTFRGLHTAGINLAINTYDPNTKTHNLQAPSPTAEEIYQFVDNISTSKLVNADGSVGCPAPKDVIVNAFLILLTGKDIKGQVVSTEGSSMGTYVSPKDVVLLKGFSDLATKYELLASRARRIAAQGLQNLSSIGIDARQVPPDVLQNLILSEKVHDPQTALDADQILLEMGALQLAANRILGRTLRREPLMVSPQDALA